jgi:hypothetical protein
MSRRVFLICDRCPTEAQTSEDIRGWSSHLVSTGPVTTKTIDLCPACSRSLQAWLLSAEDLRVERAALAGRVAALVAELAGEKLDEEHPQNVGGAEGTLADKGYRKGFNARTRDVVERLRGVL